MGECLRMSKTSWAGVLLVWPHETQSSNVAQTFFVR